MPTLGVWRLGRESWRLRRMSKKIFFNIILANIAVGSIISLLFLLGFQTGVMWPFVFYNNHLLSEPLRFVSMFLGPCFLLMSFCVWRFVTPLFVKFFREDLSKFLEERE